MFNCQLLIVYFIYQSFHKINVSILRNFTWMGNLTPEEFGEYVNNAECNKLCHNRIREEDKLYLHVFNNFKGPQLKKLWCNEPLEVEVLINAGNCCQPPFSHNKRNFKGKTSIKHSNQ